jgi:predicted acylesterase/phospholipase RssA
MLRIAGLALLMLTVAGCGGITRTPSPTDQVMTLSPYGIDIGGGRVMREWGDDLSIGDMGELIKAYAARWKAANPDKVAAGKPVRETILALSGGGPDGAFSAGLLKGWTASGERPQFNVVTGISTGAIVAVFAFLGPDYDATLEEIYTTYRTEQLVNPRILAGLFGGVALTDTAGYRALIEKYVDDDLVAKLAEASADGRSLLIGTTNLDAVRPVVWNVSTIAASGHPKAKTLIQDVIEASSAIPGAFPPVIIPVEAADGTVYDEMHVDGGATQQVMFFSPEFSIKEADEAIGLPFDRSIYVVVNNALRKQYRPVRPRLLSIVGRSASSLISGSGTGDTYKIFAIAQRDGIDFNLLCVPSDFLDEPEEPFDPAYMRTLYDIGYQYGLAGDKWRSYPPDYKP